MEENLGFSTLTYKWQVRLPEKVIEVLNLSKNDAVVFKNINGEVIIRKGRVIENGGNKNGN